MPGIAPGLNITKMGGGVILKKRILLALSLCFCVWLITASAMYGATVISKSLNATVKIVSKGDFSFYSDAAATQLISSVNLPDVTPGGTSTFTVYIKNISQASLILNQGTTSVPSSAGTLSLSFDGQSQKTLAAGAISRLVGTLSALTNATAGDVNFTVAVNAAPLTTGSAPPPTSASNVSYASVIQPAFNQSCISCHGSSGGVNLGSYTAVMSSSYHGTTIVTAGNSANSTLYQAVSGGNMSGYGLSASQVQALSDWINQGALNN
jgi:mono/diheme cytochrome c family protein